MAKIKEFTRPSVDETAKQLSYTSDETAKNSVTLENSVAIAYKVKHTLSIWPHNFTPSYLSR